MTPEERREALAKTIWEASRADEGTISATGANIVANAIASLVESWIAEYESAISWETTCFNCARLLDRSYDEWVKGHRAGMAEGWDEGKRAMAHARLMQGGDDPQNPYRRGDA